LSPVRSTSDNTPGLFSRSRRAGSSAPRQAPFRADGRARAGAQTLYPRPRGMGPDPSKGLGKYSRERCVFRDRMWMSLVVGRQQAGRPRTRVWASRTPSDWGPSPIQIECPRGSPPECRAYAVWGGGIEDRVAHAG